MSDALIIFAVLLGADPAHIISLPARSQMKAILASQEKLPISFLCIKAARHEPGENLEHLDESWIPVSPVGVTSLNHSCSMVVEESGLRLKQPGQAEGFRYFNQWNPGTFQCDDWALELDGRDLYGEKTDAEYRIRPHSMGIARRVLHNISSVLLLVELPESPSPALSRQGTGAYLLPLKVENGDLHVRYGFSFS